MAFAFVSNQTAFMNYLELKNRGIKRWSISTTMAITVSLAVSLSLAIIGYAAFGEDVQDNVLSSFPDHDPYINGARFILAISMFFTYPMQVCLLSSRCCFLIPLVYMARRPLSLWFMSHRRC